MAKLGFTKRSQAFDPTPDTIPKAEVRGQYWMRRWLEMHSHSQASQACS